MAATTCSFCQKDATKLCGSCNQVYYCSKEHQKEDWRQHKPSCRPFKVVNDSEIGRHLVATRNIKVGEVVLREQPLMRGPNYISSTVCLACMKEITPLDSSPCEKCGWPLCRQESCRQSKEHLPECEWARLKKTPVRNVFGPNHEYPAISILRLCYARRHQPELWSILSTLETNKKERQYTMKYEWIDKLLANHILEDYDIPGFSKEDILDMLGIIEVNGFEVGDGDGYQAVYNLASLINHSCLPNCNKTFAPDGELTIRAGHDIRRNDHIYISYTDGYLGTTRRFKHLLKTKHFSCRCVRCTDNTEMGTYYSAILCPKGGCGGPMLPESLCNLAPATLWTCDRCTLTIPHLEVKLQLKVIECHMKSIDKADYFELMKFLNTWSNTLHPNHHYLVEVEHDVVRLLNKESRQGPRSLPDHKLDCKISLSRHLNYLMTIITSAELRVRGKYKYMLYECLVEKVNRLRSQRGGDSSSSRCIMSETIVTLAEACSLIRKQPEYMDEGDECITGKLRSLSRAC